MNEKTIAAISLSNRDYNSFAEKVTEAAYWCDHAANNGADLILLPEYCNKWRGDGPAHPAPLSYGEAALDDWQTAVQPVIEVAQRRKVAVCIPLIVRENDRYHNSMFLVSGSGETIGRYNKMRPTPEELESGIIPGGIQPPMEWEGLKVGGAICFDTLFEEVFSLQAEMGADLFLVGSYWPGGTHLNYYAMHYCTPIAIAYPAWSRIVDINGRDITGTGYRNETLRFGFGTPVAMAVLNFDRVTLYGNHNQEKIVAIEQKYGSRVRIAFDQANVNFYLESRSPDLTVSEIIEEFELIPARQYFAECRRKAREFN